MTPVQTASAVIIVSGAAHAVVNAILKSGRDKMSSRALMDGFSALIVLPFAFIAPPPWRRLAALRETSIRFGAGIAIVFLKERLTRGRLIGIATIAAGAAILLAAG